MIDIRITAVKKKNNYGPGDYFIMQEVDKDITINLKDWFIQFLPPEEGEGVDGERNGGQWELVLQPRRKLENGNEERENTGTNRRRHG